MIVPYTILFVDDDEDVRENIAEILSENGFRLLAARREDGAMRLFGEEHVDASLTDIVMQRSTSCQRSTASIWRGRPKGGF